MLKAMGWKRGECLGDEGSCSKPEVDNSRMHTKCLGFYHLLLFPREQT